MRPVVWCGVAAALFAMPVSTMVVPLVHEMRATDVLSGAACRGGGRSER